jgi:diguanylate cyclase (GGDEF)-like protein/PAS domain S-box-containing protein
MQESPASLMRANRLRPAAFVLCLLASGLLAGAALGHTPSRWIAPRDTILLLSLLAALPSLGLLYTALRPGWAPPLPAERSLVVAASARAEAEYRLLFDANPMPMWVFDRVTLRFLAVNEAAVRQYGFSREEFLSMTILDIRPPECAPLVVADVAIRRGGLQAPGQWTHRRKDGSLVEVQVVCHDLVFAGVDAMLVAAHDVTECYRAHQAVVEAEERYRAIFNNAVIGIFQHTIDGSPVRVNPALARMHGYDSPEQYLAEVHDIPGHLFVHPERLAELARQADEHGTVRNAEVELYTRDRRRIWARVNMLSTHDSDGHRFYEGTAEDITDRKTAEAQVHFLAWHDRLTGLPNRALFQDRLQTALEEAEAARSGENLAVLFLDFDRFKNINDTLGHSVGDRVIQAAAQRLAECLDKGDITARLGADEFLFLLRRIETPEDAEFAARRLMDALREPIIVDGHALHCSCSIGISLFPEHAATPEALISNADAAMYAVREAGGNNFRFFSPEMNSHAAAQLTLENHLRSALEEGQFSLAWQPQVDLVSGRLTGIEALLRWKHPTLGQIVPSDFIPVAESSGLILSIGEWVLRTACQKLQVWRLRGLPVAPVAVNVSALQFLDDRFVSLVREVLAETGLPPEFLELELTESVLLSTADVMASTLDDLRAIGVSIAIDDFGTGYSSLSYLRRLRAHKIKIDRSFISDFASGNGDAAIAIAIIRMAKTLNLQVLAEGVETEAQAHFLREHGCDQIQGYFISRPLPPDAMSDYLRTSAAPQKQPAAKQLATDR